MNRRKKQYRDALACSPKEPIILEKLGNLALMGRKKEEEQRSIMPILQRFRLKIPSS